MKGGAGCACAWAIAGVVAGCKTPYLDASRDFAAATVAGVAAFDGIFDLASSLCQRRARYAYELYLLDPTDVEEADKDKCPLNDEERSSGAAPWTVYFAEYCLPVAQAGGGTGYATWRAHCEELKIADAVVGTALTALASYGHALARIAAADYSGADMSNVVKDSSTFIKAIPANGSHIGAMARALGDPVGALAGSLEKQYAERHVAQLVIVAAPSVAGIIDALQRYRRAVSLEQKDASGYLSELSKGFEHRLNVAEKQAPMCSVAPLLLADVEMRWGAELQSNLDRLEVAGSGLAKLAEASDALRRAADSPDPDESAALKTVVSNSATVVHDVNALVMVLTGKGG